MVTDLQSLAYFSRNRASNAGALADDVDQILRASRYNNRRLGITGALLFTEGWYAQVLEGPQLAVEAVFEKVMLDQRHGDVRVLHLRQIEKRSFGKWSMAFAGSVNGAALVQQASVMVEGLADLGMPVTGDNLTAVLQRLIAETRPAPADPVNARRCSNGNKASRRSGSQANE